MILIIISAITTMITKSANRLEARKQNICICKDKHVGGDYRQGLDW
jgi:hypothetical protein